MTVLFASEKELYRAENLKTVYDAYNGDKVFIKWGMHKKIAEDYDLMVTDAYPTYAPKKCIHINHAMGAGKLIGLDQADTIFKNPKLLTYMITSSEDMIPIIAKQCGLPKSKIIPTGLPRSDAYFRNIPDRPTNTHLYAPTFRMRANWYPNVDKIASHLPVSYKLIVKPHIYTGDKVFHTKWNNVPVVSCNEPTTPCLKYADTVVTDFSSIMFDAMVMRKPVILFAKDTNEYLSDRGMYMPYPEKYSPYYCEDEKELCKLIGEAKWNDDLEELRSFYAGSCDGHSTERVIDLIRSLL